MRALVAALAALALAGCASHQQMVMLNRHTGTTVGCDLPSPTGGSGDFLASRACLSACQAHGFIPLPGVEGQGGGGIPAPCLN